MKHFTPTVEDLDLLDSMVVIWFSKNAEDAEPIQIDRMKFESWLVNGDRLKFYHINHYQVENREGEMTMEEYWSIHNESQKRDLCDFYLMQGAIKMDIFSSLGSILKAS